MVSKRHYSAVNYSTYVYIIFELNSPGRIELNLLESLSHDIVRLSLRLLGGLDGSRLVNVSLIIYIKLAESVLQAKDLVLLELRKLPVIIQC